MSTTYTSLNALAPLPPPERDVRATPPQTSRKRSATPGFRRDIEGLRAVAVLLVVGYHAGLGFISGGYIGVDVFFVISGFLITGNLFRELERTGKISLRRFYGRRMTRLLPASTIVVLGTLAAAWHWMPPLTVKAVSWDALASGTWAMNYRLAIQNTDYLGSQREPSPLQHFWSLAVEEQFYLLWPILLILASMAWARRGRPSVMSAAIVLSVLSAASLAMCIWQTTDNLPWAYFGIHTRAWELGIGALVALGAHRLANLPAKVAAPITWTGLLVVVVAALTYTDATVFPGYAALVPVLGTAMIIAGGCSAPSWGARRVLRIKPMQEVGRLSYSWYLWHWPILILAPHVMGSEPTVLVKCLLMLAALIPAAMSMAAVENQIRFHRIFRTRPTRGLALGGGLTAAAAAVALVTLQLPVPTVDVGTRTAADTAGVLASGTLTPEQTARLIRVSSVATSLPRNLKPNLLDAPKDFPHDGNCTAPGTERSIAWNLRNGCERRGVATGTTTVVLFGDSHAQHWFDALDVVAQQRRWRLVVFIKGGCTPATALTYKDTTRIPYTECAQWREEALKRIEELRPAMVVMSALGSTQQPIGTTARLDKAWANAWEVTSKRIQGAGAQSVIIQDTPFPRTDVPNCLSQFPRSIGRCNLDRSTSVDVARQRAIARMAAAKKVRIIDPTNWFCTASVCPSVIGDVLVYRDSSHVSATYSRLLGTVFGQELLR